MSLVLSKEFFVKKLIEYFENVHAHKDYHDLNKKQLNLMTKIIGIEDKIYIDYDKKMVILKPMNYVNEKILKKIDTPYYKGKEVPVLDQDKINSYVSYAQMYLNLTLEKMSYELNFGRGELCTNEVNEAIKSLLNIRSANMVIASHRKALHDQYTEIISEIIDFVYSKPININDRISKINEGAWFNKVLTKEEESIINEFLDDMDYF